MTGLDVAALLGAVLAAVVAVVSVLRVAGHLTGEAAAVTAEEAAEKRVSVLASATLTAENLAVEGARLLGDHPDPDVAARADRRGPAQSGANSAQARLGHRLADWRARRVRADAELAREERLLDAEAAHTAEGRAKLSRAVLAADVVLAVAATAVALLLAAAS